LRSFVVVYPRDWCTNRIREKRWDAGDRVSRRHLSGGSSGRDPLSLTG